jgi:HlyD family secretion protein
MNQELRALLFIPLSDGYQIRKGMKAQVSPSQVKKSEFGYLLGKVRGATKFPISHEDLTNVVQNEDLVGQITSSGPCLQAIVELTPDPGTVSGYKWSSARGAPVELYGGSPCEVQIILRVQKPIQLVFPSLGAEGEP